MPQLLNSASALWHQPPFVTADGQVKVFEGNRNQNTVVRNTFTRPFSARYVRIYPLTWSWVPGLRWELYEGMPQAVLFMGFGSGLAGGGGGLLRFGHQLPPQLTVGGRPLIGGGGVQTVSNVAQM